MNLYASGGLSTKINIYSGNKKYFYIFCLLEMPMGEYNSRAKLNPSQIYLENDQ